MEPLQTEIAAVIKQHPEYHPLLENPDQALGKEYLPELGETNPFLHMGMHIALREQAGTDRPPGMQAIYYRLVASRGQHEAEHAMMECLGQSLWNAQRNGIAADETEYLDCLKKL